jgi:preprotein translocase subunit SecE
MDPQMRLLIRLVKWLRHPPSRQTVWIMGIAIVASLLIFGFEQLFGWPDWLTVDRGPRVVR